ncbi:MAG TPA: ATPase, T2SS/T4P/T4SS family [Candidatus Angelobacter sp.]|nr:ATPase, T2SS/T4P/T4SS family [Candidatus Angelobacter sp.]
MPLTPIQPMTAPALHPAFRLILPYLRPIERLILDPEISEIMVNSPNDVFIEKHGVLEKVPQVTISADQLRVAVQNIARSLGDDISEEKPILDSRLPDGSRIAAVLPPCSIQGITLTIRKFNARSFTIHDLIRIGTITAEMAAYLEASILNRKNILISGGTGTGKTTLLNILADFIPDDDRLLVIEDTAEIHIRKPNLVRFEARRQQGPKIPAITIRDLLKASLRHRPERTILGEIRGEEAFDLLQALNTGHSGSLSTIHANSATQALSRLASCVLQSGIELPYKAIKASIADSINLLIHVERRHGSRRVQEILSVKSYSPTEDSYDLRTVFTHNQPTQLKELNQ